MLLLISFEYHIRERQEFLHSREHIIAFISYKIIRYSHEHNSMVHLILYLIVTEHYVHVRIIHYNILLLHLRSLGHLKFIFTYNYLSINDPVKVQVVSYTDE